MFTAICHITRLIVSTVAFISAPALADEYTPVTLPVLRPAATFSQSLESDGPIEHTVLTNDGALWLLGEKHLWTWYPLTGSVRRVTFPTNFSLVGSHRALGFHQNSIYFAVGGRLHRFLPTSGQVETFAGQWSLDCKDIRFLGDQEILLLTHSCGSVLVHVQKKSLQSLVVPKKLATSKSLVYSDECQCFYAANGREILRYIWNGASFQESLVYKAKANLRGVALTENNLAAWTAYAVLVFNATTGTRVQVIPAAADRSILAAAFAPNLHLIQFDDGLTEIMVPSINKRWTSRLKESAQRGVILDPAGAFAVITKEAEPTVVGLGFLTSPVGTKNEKP